MIRDVGRMGFAFVIVDGENVNHILNYDHAHTFHEGSLVQTYDEKRTHAFEDVHLLGLHLS